MDPLTPRRKCSVSPSTWQPPASQSQRIFRCVDLGHGHLMILTNVSPPLKLGGCTSQQKPSLHRRSSCACASACRKLTTAATRKEVTTGKINVPSRLFFLIRTPYATIRRWADSWPIKIEPPIKAAKFGGFRWPDPGCARSPGLGRRHARRGRRGSAPSPRTIPRSPRSSPPHSCGIHSAGRFARVPGPCSRSSPVRRKEPFDDPAWGVRRTFRRFDKDHDGRLDKSELNILILARESFFWMFEAPQELAS